MAKTPASHASEPTVQWIDSTHDLKDFCDHAKAHPIVAVDTEFHRERTYYAQLALVQLRAGDRMVAVDPLADIDLQPLYDLLQDDDVLKVLHAAKQDAEIFLHAMKTPMAPVFDTQVAAALLGYGEQVSYGFLVEKLTGVALDKLHGRSDWMRRPLDKAVVDYAIDDVRYLPEMHARLQSELDDKGRRTWLDEEQADLTDASKLVTNPDEAWRKIKGAGKLKGKSVVVAQQVTAWRERMAMKRDLPKRHVLADNIVIDLARQRPKELKQMDRMRGFDDGAKRRYGKELLACIREAEGIAPELWPAPKESKPRRVDDALVSCLWAVVELQARENDISPQLLVSKGDLQKLAAQEEDIDVLAGWRRDLVGERLLAFLAGEVVLGVSGRKAQLQASSEA